MTSSEIRSKFLAFFAKRGHAIIPSASLVTPDEKGITNSTLFNTAGMQPLVPYLLGKPHPEGNRLVDAQKCLRTVDIDDIGDKTHATFFEMLGNWSLGDYFKKEAISWSYEFLTSKEEGLGLDPRRLYVTVFEGDENAPRDEEAALIWKDIFAKNNIEGNRIFYLPAKNNWWEAGENGPCGPDTEMFYDVTNRFGGKGVTHEEYMDADDKRDVVEIWNDVFMQYEKNDGKIIGKLPKPSVDTGAGLERLTMVIQGVDNIYDTDLFIDTQNKIRSMSGNYELRSARIIADHLRTSIFLIAEGLVPDKKERASILRKLLRRAMTNAEMIDMKFGQDREYYGLFVIVDIMADLYKKIYPEIESNKARIKEVLMLEELRFQEIIRKIKERVFSVAVIPHGTPIDIRNNILKNNKEIPATFVFDLYQSEGFPLEIMEDICKRENITFDKDMVLSLIKKHQDLSRSGAEQKFKGGLSDAENPIVVKYHTATHLLHQALHDVLGDGANQKGSNITPERLRFDFAFDRKMTDEEKKKVEDIVNAKIKEALPMKNIVMPKEEAEKTGARHFFGEKYGDMISIYFIGDTLETAYSKEFCGGPHVKNTSELSTFKIQKEEASSQGVRRIKAVLV